MTTSSAADPYSDVLHLREENAVGDLHHVVVHELPAFAQRPGKHHRW